MNKPFLMKNFLLLLTCIYIIIDCDGQQKKLDSLLNELKQHPKEDTIRLDLLHNISIAYQAINPDEGIIISNENIALAKKLKNEIGLGNAFNSKGCNYENKGKYDSSLMMFKMALQIFEKLNYERGVFAALNNMGIAQYYTSDYSNTLKTCLKNLGVAENSKDTNQIMTAVSNLSLVFRASSNYAEALRYDLKAINLAEKSNNVKYFVNVYTEAGLTYRELKETEKAKQYYQKALKYCIQTENKRAEATVLSALGQVSIDKKDYQQALSYYQQSISIGSSVGNMQTVAATLGSIGDAYKSISNYDTAIGYYKRALAICQKLGDKNNTAYVLAEIGDTYANAPRQRNQALSYLQKGLAMAKEIGSLDRQETALFYLSNFYEKQKNYQKALDLNKQANTVQDSIFNDKTKTTITRLEMQYQFNKTGDSIKVVTDRQQLLAKAEIQKQHVIETAMIAGAVFLILAGICGFVFYKRHRDIRAQKNEAELRAQVIGTEMKALLAQMKPHFIFNALSSIADYIRNNQPKIAADFTDGFARLMRTVLKNSEQKDISLKDDLNALEIYMQLERCRLQDKFDYSIQVSESIDQENTLVPPLILQPLVENSIWHGVVPKAEKGHISICIMQQGNMLYCVVEDDGVGIKETTICNEEESMGLKITKARIDMINKFKNAGASLTVINKKIGVKAEVKLPLNLKF